MRARRTTALVLVWLLCALAAGAPWGFGGGAGRTALAAEVRNQQGVAVIIGNRDYAHQDVPDVDFAHRDAAAFRRYVVEVLGYEPANIIDERDASLTRMMELFGNERSHEGDLYWMLDPSGRSDVVVFYSGHGVPGLADRSAYLLPVEAGPDNAEISAYPLALLYDNLGRLAEARSVRVFMDACFSGNSHAGMLIRRASPASVTPRLPGAAGEKLTVLTAASADQIASWDEDARHGLFTRHLLDALYGGGDADGDGRVTSSEAKAYLDREMTDAARQLRRRQRASLIEGPQPAVLSARPEAGFPVRRPIALMTAGGIPAEDLSPAATRLSRLLGRPFSAEARDEVGWTDLHYAAVLDLPELIATLIDAEAPVDARLEEDFPPFGERLQETLRDLGHEYFSDWTADGETPLFIAAFANSAAAARELIVRGADIGATNAKGAAPLHLAAKYDAADVITALIAHGADVDSMAKANGLTPLHYAALGDAGAAVTELLTQGAEIEFDSSLEEYDNITPLERALLNDSFVAASALIAGGANANGDGVGWSTLSMMANYGKLEAVKFLIDNGADVNRTDQSGLGPLHYVNWGDVATVLIDAGADVHAKANENLWAQQANGGETPLHMAFEPDKIAALIAAGADVNARATDGETPLHRAARFGMPEAMAALIESGADIRAKSNSGETILDLWEKKYAGWD